VRTTPASWPTPAPDARQTQLVLAVTTSEHPRSWSLSAGHRGPTPVPDAQPCLKSRVMCSLGSLIGARRGGRQRGATRHGWASAAVTISTTRCAVWWHRVRVDKCRGVLQEREHHLIARLYPAGAGWGIRPVVWSFLLSVRRKCESTRRTWTRHGEQCWVTSWVDRLGQSERSREVAGQRLVTPDRLRPAKCSSAERTGPAARSFSEHLFCDRVCVSLRPYARADVSSWCLTTRSNAMNSPGQNPAAPRDNMPAGSIHPSGFDSRRVVWSVRCLPRAGLSDALVLPARSFFFSQGG